MKNVDDDQDEVSKEIDRLVKRGHYREAVLYALKQGRPRTAGFLAQYYEGHLDEQDTVRICQVFYGLGAEDDNPYPNPRMAQTLASRWLITEEAHHQGVYIYPSEIEDLVNQNLLDEAEALLWKTKAPTNPDPRKDKNRYYRESILAEITRRRQT